MLAEQPKPLRGPRCSYTEWRRRWVKRLSSLKTGAAPIPTCKFVSAPRPTTCRGTFAGAVSHQRGPSSTSVRRWQTGRCNRAPVSLCALLRAGADLPVLRPRQHLLRAGLRRAEPAQQTARSGAALSSEPPRASQACRACTALSCPAATPTKSDASGFTYRGS